MTLNEYQQQAMTTCLPESENFSYMMLNLAAEVGEIAGKVAKMIRKDQVRFCWNGDLEMYFMNDTEAQTREAQAREEELLKDVARQNLQKLADRQQRHVIDGSGDNR